MFGIFKRRPKADKADQANLDRIIPTIVVGVTYDNDDGSSRQKIISRCTEGEDLLLEHQPDNPHDPNAVAVVKKRTGEQIGFLEARLAKDIIRLVEKEGRAYVCQILHIKGGTRDKPTLGVNIKIGIAEPRE